MSLALAQFAQQQIDAQGLTVKEFARRSGLGVSHAYQILRGQRPNASAETVEAVARGLSMTPAEMLTAMGKGAGGLAPDEAEVLAIFRQVPQERRDVVRDLLRAMGVKPAARLTGANRRDDVAAKTTRQLETEQPAKRSSRGKHGSDDALRKNYGFRNSTGFARVGTLQAAPVS